MAGNSFGQLFRVTTFGESHGVAMGAIVDGCPPGLSLSTEDIQHDLDRRAPGRSRFTTQRKEPDVVEILSGVFEGKTTGTPIGLLVKNLDQKSKDYGDIQDLYRPSHADFTYDKKYGFRDYRGGGRASARETVMRVAAAGIAKKYLKEHFSLEVRGYLSQIGHIRPKFKSWDAVEKNPFFCPDPEMEETIGDLINNLREEGDSIGAELTISATGVPVGLGEPVFDKLDAELAGSLMGINAVKAVGIGDGFSVVEQKGTDHRDEMDSDGFKTNRSGGVLGGISSGEDISLRIAVKPTSSITTPGQSVTNTGEEVEVVTKGRHDPCVGIRAIPIAEAMVALVLMDHVLRHRAQNPERAGQ